MTRRLLLLAALLLALPGAAGPDAASQRSVEDASLRQLPAAPRAAAPSPQTAGLVPQAEPSGALTGPVYTASATWCAPTPTQCQSWGGDALLGAVYGFRWGDEPYRVRVSRGDASVDVTVVSFCQCGGTHNAIDLSPAAFADLAEPGREPDDYSSLARGRLDVLVEVLGEGPRVAATAPPTDR